MKFQIGLTLFVCVVSSLSYGELTNSKFGTSRFVPTYNSTVIQARPVPVPREEAPVVVAQATIQERPRAVVNSNPNSARSGVIASRGGVAATQACGGAIEITNMSGVCNELEYDRDFLSFLHNQGLTCAREAGRAAFGFTPTQIKFRTHEGQVSAGRRSSNGKYSTHSAGRALDVFKVEIYNGAAHSDVTMHGSYMDRRGHRTFYHGFRDCWKRAVNAARGDLAGSSGSGCLGYDYNSDHWDHMHISLPPKDENRRRYTLNST